MPEFVMLPIIDERGFQTNRNLLIDTRHFLGAAGSEIAHNYIKVVENNEVEVLDRIIHGLPAISKQELVGNWTPREKPKQLADDVIPDPMYVSQERIRDFIEKGYLHSVSVEPNRQFGTIELVDDVEPPKLRVEDKWRVIPGFSNYEMSPYRAIATGQDGLSVSIMRGRVDNVLLIDDEGNTKRMSVDYLFQRTFPEYAK